MLLARPSTFIVYGSILMLLGVICAAFPKAFAVSAGMLCGLCLLAAGLLLWVFARVARGWPGFRPSLFSALALILAGLFLLAFPPAGVLAVGTLLTAFFLVDALLKLFMAFSARGMHGWGWLAAHGLVSLLFAAMALSEWPTSAVWLLGLIVGIHLLLKGWTLVVLGLASQSAARQQHST